MRIPTLLLAAALVLGPSPHARGEPPVETVEDILCRATSALGFSYAWGGECWCASGCAPDFGSCEPGVCTPNAGSSGCPDCTHSGAYGADCSGFVSRAWQVPSPLAVDACGTDRYVASTFTSDHAFWDVVSVSALEAGDAAATSSHVVLVVGGRDAAGEYEVIEAMGCVYGIVRNRRSLGSYHGARRINLEACACADGEVETRNCGDCGTEERSCTDGCSWSPWSDCEGPDPSGEGSACTVEGETGVCAEGRRLCVAGWLTCEPPGATAEVCDGLDNDCDGVVDNGTAESLGEGDPCTSTCGAGEYRCVDGALRCVTDVPCDGGPGEDGGPGDGGAALRDPSGMMGSCACHAATGERSTPLAWVLALLGLLALRRRHG